MDFSELKLARPLLKAVGEQGYEKPSPIQEKAIPPVLEGRDLLGCAQTGTGKTAAFALPILQRLAAGHPNHKGVRALILTPTRELALQIDECFENYGRYVNVSHAVIFGGVGQAPQVAALGRGVEVLTACPGRLNDLIGQGFVDLAHLEVFVLDEADRMLDMGFVHDVKRVIKHLPAQRQNLLFSATMPKEIEQLAGSILKRPVSVKVDPPASTVDKIRQSLYFVEKGDKKRLLAFLLADPEVKNALVFSRTKHGANAIAAFLIKQGVGAAAIHGNKSQSARVAALESFKAGRIKALVATDIAARGIDISELTHVFQLDLPEVPETYVHRIGRTGRAGAEGTAVSFCSAEERDYLQGIEKLIKKKIPVVKDHPYAPGAPRPAQEEEQEREPRQAARPAQPKKEQSARRAGQNERPQIVKGEEPTMEEKQNQPGEGLSASAKRRRRRRRATGKPAGAPAAAAQQPAPGQGAKQAAPQRQPQKPARAERPAPPQKAQPRGPERGGKNERRASRPEPRHGAAPAQPTGSEDPGLLLISPKAPAQKFSSFEEYMQNRGGPGGPIPDGNGEE